MLRIHPFARIRQCVLNPCNGASDAGDPETEVSDRRQLKNGREHIFTFSNSLVQLQSH